MDEDAWRAVARLNDWLTGDSPRPTELQRVLQVLKVSEEAGEVAEAVIGALGANPRKGHSHTWDDVSAELCDVIITAMVALTRIDPAPAERFRTHLAKVTARSLP
ncbi:MULTISPECIES: MazG-like family protein [Kitasatospora]|uniref:NTP pyrophosphatase (Non-canonical NTP hydrolase) n=2 Tax=Kitasatospora TaxID=2063 RepID=A0ABT1J4F5_9ACTN|nr:MazG-like family protein [Kitasatospora paracochleata]MCP2312109.1 NTP pyrophosphatase (non-canonical NTP hydrolase) [Kitasatospora paracochleata]